MTTGHRWDFMLRALELAVMLRPATTRSPPAGDAVAPNYIDEEHTSNRNRILYAKRLAELWASSTARADPAPDVVEEAVHLRMVNSSSAIEYFLVPAAGAQLSQAVAETTSLDGGPGADGALLSVWADSHANLVPTTDQNLNIAQHREQASSSSLEPDSHDIKLQARKDELYAEIAAHCQLQRQRILEREALYERIRTITARLEDAEVQYKLEKKAVEEALRALDQYDRRTTGRRARSARRPHQARPKRLRR
ncbi:hypothetical protein FA95DRAFT_1577991 [Auriscalpium vulgare]|uniref:Uncharacterized protein n=1 Tax=Auriscalpium vulgare TaxID=40419 RepID=A0ACB8R4I2_9AGAM|nr:hypothetical protein FA95DRAFT_1577991 [Auriscalpium vulgare]